MRQPREDLLRLASYVIDARIRAGYPTRKDLADAIGVTARTLGKLETAAEPVSPDTLVRVSAAVGWTPDSPRRIMRGGEPVTAAAPAPQAAAEHDALAAIMADERLSLPVRRAMVALAEAMRRRREEEEEGRATRSALAFPAPRDGAERGPYPCVPARSDERVGEGPHLPGQLAHLGCRFPCFRVEDAGPLVQGG